MNNKNADQSAPLLFVNHEDRFSHVKAQFIGLIPFLANGDFSGLLINFANSLDIRPDKM